MPSLNLKATLFAHSSPAWCVAWSPQDLLASCGADRVVHLWKKSSDGVWALVTSSPQSTFLRAVRQLSWSTDARSLAVASFDATATVLHVVGGPSPQLDPLVCLEGHESEVKSVSYSSTGALLATCGRDRSVWIWEVGLDHDYDCVAVLNSHTADVKKVAWHPHMEMLVSCGFDQSLRVWLEDTDDWFCSETLMAHSATVWDMSFDADGNALASVSAEGDLVVWKREQPPPSAIGAQPRFVVAARSKVVEHDPIYSVDWNPEYNVIATGCGDDSIRILAMQQDSQLPSVNGKQPTNSTTEQDAGQADSQPTSRHTESWQVVSLVERAHSGDVNCVAWGRQDRNLLASCGDDGVIRIWSFEKGQAVESRPLSTEN